MKRLFAVSLAILLVSCDSTVPSGPDMTPVGDGLKTIGYSLISVAVVIATSIRFIL